MEGFQPKDLNMEILAMVAKELDPERCDTGYTTPFSVAHGQLSLQDEADGDVVVLSVQDEADADVVVVD